MKAILLAAGYATRLRPLTDHRAKPLLPVGGKPIIERIYDVVAATGAVDAVHVVTNARYAPDFRSWSAQAPRAVPLVIHDDGTTSNDDRRGAIGDIAFVVAEEGWDAEDLLVVAGDNLIGPWMSNFTNFWQQRAADEAVSATALYRCPDPELVKAYSAVTVDPGGRILTFVEKPQVPPSDLVGIGVYAYHREHVARLGEYLASGNSPDQPGHLLAWLCSRAPVYGYRFDGEWIDIGNREQLRAADDLVRAREGLPRLDHYALETSS